MNQYKGHWVTKDFLMVYLSKSKNYHRKGRGLIDKGWAKNCNVASVWQFLMVRIWKCRKLTLGWNMELQQNIHPYLWVFLALLLVTLGEISIIKQKSMTIGSVLTFCHACLHNVETAKLQSCLWVRWFKTSNCIWVSTPFLSIPWRSDRQKDRKSKTLEFVLAEPPLALVLKKSPPRGSRGANLRHFHFAEIFCLLYNKKNIYKKAHLGFWMHSKFR